MSFAVVLDTCVLYPAHLRDTLLRLAETGVFRALWSEDILRELRRNLLKAGIAEVAVDHILVEMSRAFPDAMVTGHHGLIASMTCDEKDRHVLAAAVRADAPALVTFNLKDFPLSSVNPFEIDVIHPDSFLLDQLDLASALVLDQIRLQAGANRQAPKTVSSVLSALEKAGVPHFVEGVRRALRDMG